MGTKVNAPIGGGGKLEIANSFKTSLPVLDDEIKANLYSSISNLDPVITDIGTYSFPTGTYPYSGSYTVNGGVKIAENKYLLYGIQYLDNSLGYEYAQVMQYSPEDGNLIFGDPINIYEYQIRGQSAIKIEDVEGKQRVLYTRGSSDSKNGAVISRVLEIDGFNISMGPVKYITTRDQGLFHSMLYLGNNRAIINYSNNQTLYSVIVDVSSNTITEVSAKLRLTRPSGTYFYDYGDAAIDVSNGLVVLASITGYSSPYYMCLHVLKVVEDTITELVCNATVNANTEYGSPKIVIEPHNKFNIVYGHKPSTYQTMIAGCSFILNEDNSVSLVTDIDLGVPITNSQGNTTDYDYSKTANFVIAPNIIMYRGHIVLFQGSRVVYVGVINLNYKQVIGFNNSKFLLSSYTVTDRKTTQTISKTTQTYGLVKANYMGSIGLAISNAVKGENSDILMVRF